MQVARTALLTIMACKYTCRAPENARESISTLRILNNSLKAYQIYSPHVRGITNSFAQAKRSPLNAYFAGLIAHTICPPEEAKEFAPAAPHESPEGRKINRVRM